MTLQALVLALLLAGAGGCAQATAPNPTTPTPGGWQALYEQALRQHAASDHVGAEASARQALALARQGPDLARRAPFVASSLNALALTRQAQGQPDEAVALLREAVALSESALGAHPNTASLAFNLAQAIEQQGAAGEAEPWYERSLAIARDLPGQTGAVLREKCQAALDRLRGALQADALAAQARAWQAQGQAEAARTAWAQALAIREAREPDDPRLAELLNELALLHMAKQEHAAAEALLDRALRVVAQHQGPGSVEAARLVGTQALLQGERGQDARAQALHQRAFDLYAQQPLTPEVLLGQAQALNHIAGLVYRKRRFDQAELLFLRALALAEQAVGGQDARLLPLLDNLQALYRSMGRRDETLSQARRADTVRRASAGAGAPEVLP